MQGDSAIVLAMFGTTVEQALGSLLAIEAAMEAAFPYTPVKMAFTSNQIRRRWRERGDDPAYLAAHPSAVEERRRITEDVLGFIEAGAHKYAGQIPLILKVNNSDSLSKLGGARLRSLLRGRARRARGSPAGPPPIRLLILLMIKDI